ncbi:MAG: ABC transporter substrate-binding protein [Burkholderiales bacterium]
MTIAREERSHHSERITSRTTAGAVSIWLLTLLFAGPVAAQIEKIRFGFGFPAVSPIIINFIVPTYLGYYKQEGLEVELIGLPGAPAVSANIEQGRIEFGVGVPSFHLPVAAKGEMLGLVNFYEYTYPFKWSVAVRPDDAAQTLRDLNGKLIGVSGFGTSDFPVGKALFRLVGMDPDRDVQWLVVGEGIPAGQALIRSAIAALLHFDTGFGRIEAAGMKLRYLPLPNDVPKVGGFFIAAQRATIEKRRKTAIGFARAVAKASWFILENPEAAAYMFIQLYPEAAPRGMPLAEQIRNVAVPIVKRAPLYKPYEAGVKEIGRISRAEWDDEITFNGLQGKIANPHALYTNDLIAEINQFDRQKIIDDAKAFKIPK